MAPSLPPLRPPSPSPACLGRLLWVDLLHIALDVAVHVLLVEVQRQVGHQVVPVAHVDQRARVGQVGLQQVGGRCTDFRRVSRQGANALGPRMWALNAKIDELYTNIDRHSQNSIQQATAPIRPPTHHPLAHPPAHSTHPPP